MSHAYKLPKVSFIAIPLKKDESLKEGSDGWVDAKRLPLFWAGKSLALQAPGRGKNLTIYFLSSSPPLHPGREWAGWLSESGDLGGLK